MTSVPQAFLYLKPFFSIRYITYPITLLKINSLHFQEEVFGIHDSEDDEEEKEDLEPLGDEMDSDIEGKEDDDGLPDSKAWGTKKKSYYNTDYVDQDYGGIIIDCFTVITFSMI